MNSYSFNVISMQILLMIFILHNVRYVNQEKKV